MADFRGSGHTHAAFISLLRVSSAVEYPDDVVFDYRGYRCGPVNKFIRVPFADELVCRGHVFLQGGISITLKAAFVPGNALFVVIHRYLRSRVDCALPLFSAQ